MQPFLDDAPYPAIFGRFEPTSALRRVCAGVAPGDRGLGMARPIRRPRAGELLRMPKGNDDDRQQLPLHVTARRP